MQRIEIIVDGEPEHTGDPSIQDKRALTEEGTIAQHRQLVRFELEYFCRQYGVTFIVAVIGSLSEMNLEKATTDITTIVSALRTLSCAVLTGGTRGGVPELATTIAQQHTVPTIGVFPPNAQQDQLAELSLAIETLPPSVGVPTFGTETATLVQLPKYAVVIGGAMGTLAEVATMLKINRRRLSKKEQPIEILPIHGTGGVADMMSQIVQLSPELAHCVITALNGQRVVDHILERELNKRN